MTEAKRPAGVPDGFDFEYVTIGGTKYLMRELSVEEGDDIDEATKEPDGSINAKLNFRLAIAKSIIEPPIGVDDIAKWPSKAYVQAFRAFNRLSSIPADPKDSAPTS